jgi:hypothetical protein
MHKSRNLVATALVLALVAFLFAGCGGGEQANTKATATRATTRAAASAVIGDKPEALIGQSITTTDQTPADFKKSLDQRKAVVVIFYMTGPYDDFQVRSAVSSVESRYRTQVDFYSYLYSDGQKYGDLASLLKVNSTPSVIIFNRQGRVQQAWTGYADEKIIEQSVVEAMA